MSYKRSFFPVFLLLLASLFFLSISTSTAAPKKLRPTPTPTKTSSASPTITPSPISTPTSSPVTTLTPTSLLITSSPSPSPSPTPTPMPTSSPKVVLGFTTYYYTGDSSSYNSMQTNKSYINQIATATHVTDGNGNITGVIPTNQLNLAVSSGITPLVLLGNDFKSDVAKALLETPSSRQNCINNLLSIIKTNGYLGVNIDLEGIYYYDRPYYSLFISEVYQALHPLGYIVSASVPAKTSDSPTNSWNGAYDYASIGKNVDSLLLMTYDEHYSGGTPGPIASINWVKNVINYATSVVPKEKILLGLAAYGYDWASTGTKSYSVNGCINLANANNSTILWDDISKSPYFKYTDSQGVLHTVWFENASSIAYKLDIVNSSNLSGIGIWRLGLENTEYWNMIKLKLGL